MGVDKRWIVIEAIDFKEACRIGVAVDAVGAAEVWDATKRGDTGAREDADTLSLFNPFK